MPWVRRFLSLPANVGKWPSVFSVLFPVSASVRWLRAPQVAPATLSSSLIKPSCSLRASCVVHAVSGSGIPSPGPAELGRKMVAVSSESSSVSVRLCRVRHCRVICVIICRHSSVTFLFAGMTSLPAATRAVRMDWIAVRAFFRLGCRREMFALKFLADCMVTLSCSFHPRNEKYAPRYRVAPLPSGVFPLGLSNGSTRVHVICLRRPFESIAVSVMSACAFLSTARTASSGETSLVDLSR